MGMENVWGLAGRRMMMSPANHARSASIAQVMMSPAFEAAGAGTVPGGGKREYTVWKFYYSLSRKKKMQSESGMKLIDLFEEAVE